MVWVASFKCVNKKTKDEILLLGDAHIELPSAVEWEKSSSTLLLQAISSFQPDIVIFELGEYHKKMIQKFPVQNCLLLVPKTLLQQEEELAKDDNNDKPSRKLIALDPRVTQNKTPFSSWLACSFNPTAKTNVTWGDFVSVATDARKKAVQEGIFDQFYKRMAKKIKIILKEFPQVDASTNIQEAVTKFTSTKFNPTNNKHLQLLQWVYDISLFMKLQELTKEDNSASPRKSKKIVVFTGVNHIEHFAVCLCQDSNWTVTQNPSQCHPPPSSVALLPYIQPTQLIINEMHSLSLSSSFDLNDADPTEAERVELSSPFRNHLMYST